ncbi:MAG: pantoate--beta-alanine ligase [Polyangiaceae bacterium]|nr:pantoate--beta-alanine ligase [Polyangiaceae bacterium]
MQIVHAPAELRAACDAARGRGERVGLVPTMGALHVGHVRLIEEAARHTGFAAVTIFVNPTQFGPNEDYAKYPRTFDADCALAQAHGASLVFAPEAGAMYPEGEETRVRVGRTAAALCGEHRPVHFEGVTTVVAKLFALAGPSTAFFGKKDYQQLQVIRRMTRDLFLPVDLVGVPTVREPDGVALSSRNRYLSAEARAKARAIPEGLSLAAHAFEGGERRAAELVRICRERIATVADSIDYVTVADADSVVPIEDGATTPDRAVIAVAIRLGGARLIDNVVLGEDPAPLEKP